ncbi:MAG: prepilin-type N-terminal cleavage/methylation domain-containing protein [Verrucomicrobia bacterium]|nr:prepilin-type N-terminal cleavage/methylation domain-containing protein [Verrucomicrobiota bacterium]
MRGSIRLGGFSLLELVVTIALIGVVASVGVALIADDSGSAKTAKLESDIATLNQMVALYTADGGTVAGLTSPQAILDKMKRIRPQAEWQQHVGAASGRLIDVRLRARMTSQPSPDGTPRAVWNRTTQRFELTTGPGSAVSDFYFDETLAGTDFGSEKRAKSNVSFNSGSKGWVWGNSTNAPAGSYLNPQPFQPAAPAEGFNPNEAAPASPDPEVNDGTGGGDRSDNASTPPTVTRLPQPTITPSGSTFAFGSFPSTATITRNGAPSEASNLMYCINSGAWTIYNGGPIPLAPSMNLQARNVSTRPAEYSDSTTASQTYYRLTSGFTGTGDGNWGNAIGGSNLVTDIQNSSDRSTFKHGNTKLELGNGEYLDAGLENVISFTPSHLTPSSRTPGSSLER